MASQLVGLIKQLSWQDFGTPRVGKAPGPGQTLTAAETHAPVLPGSFWFDPVSPPLKVPKYHLRDNVTVTVTFDTKKSFVMAWVFATPQADQTRLLNHEQGHYNISALVGRDFFIDVMQIKAKQFTKPQDGLAEVTALNKASLSKIQAIDDLYDVDTKNGNDSTGQNQWNTFLQNAFTQARPNGETSPSGVPYKMRLIDLLKAAGKKI